MTSPRRSFDGGLPFIPSKEGVRVTIRLQPGATRSAIGGVVRLADGSTALKVRVTEPAERGKADAALIALLAKSWKRPKRDLALVAGHASRHKTLLLSGEAANLMQELRSWAVALE